jgi:hypothetical protein
VIGVLLLVKLTAKLIGVWPVASAFRLPRRDRAYTTLLMATGLTFGSISALFGLTHHLIDQAQYTELVTVVILSAFVPTLIAQQFFAPKIPGRAPREEAAAGQEPHPRLPGPPGARPMTVSEPRSAPGRAAGQPWWPPGLPPSPPPPDQPPWCPPSPPPDQPPW